MIQFDLHKTLRSATGEMQLDVNIEINEGSFLTIYGKSGAGKTSVLRMIAGLLTPDAGSISMGNEHWFDSQKNINLKSQKRQVGFLFQHYALFPHWTVQENLNFALQKGQDNSIISELIEMMELGELRDQKPETLSGGQQQRTALARCLVQRPKLLLLDEPLSALDHEMRSKLQDHLMEVHKRYELTTIMVSHDHSEILKLSDQVARMDQGLVTQFGTPSQVFEQQEISGKFQFTGEIVSIEPQDVVFVITILIGTDRVKVVVDKSEAEALSPGDKVLVASKAFNPIIKKLL